MKHITSTTNETFKLLKSLHLSKYRRKYNLFIVEGIKEMSLALAAGIHLPMIVGTDEEALAGFSGEKIVLPPNLFKQLSYRDEPGYFWVGEYPPPITLEDLENKKFVVLENVTKPGNVGAILRSADAVGDVAVVVVSDIHFDLYNPNVIRASLGAVFTVPVVVVSNSEAIKHFQASKIPQIGAVVQAENDFQEFTWPESWALWLGAEEASLSPEVQSQLDHRLRIPMNGQVDSLNVAQAATVLMYASLRAKS